MGCQILAPKPLDYLAAAFLTPRGQNSTQILMKSELVDFSFPLADQNSQTAQLD
jgi:hypothetical protein